ncbi:MAG: hypothetical protein ACOYJQ_12465 [Pseudochelatococcus sp.]|jgi:hypothetical protein|uniref:hypothetical protein n=1 Tax=Pseudochelatococcus sp. TaxID=2020869 RepID=UPI003D8F3472
MGLEPRELNQEEAERFGVAPGWWAVDEIGTPVLGPHPSREGALIGIARSGRRDDDAPGNENTEQGNRNGPRT